MKGFKIFSLVLLFSIVHGKNCYAQVTLTYTITNSPQSFTVPPCVTTVSLTAKGARGGSNTQGVLGGLGGTAFGVLAVTPGDVLNIYVGGSNGYNGGGLAGVSPCTPAIGGCGGGGTDVRLNGNSLSDRVIVGGGGGGAGGNRAMGCGRGSGGGGGGGYYGGGGGAGYPGLSGYVLPTGGSQISGGVAGTSTVYPWNNASAGALGVGGAGGLEVSSNQGWFATGLTGGTGGGLVGGPGQFQPWSSPEEQYNNGCGSSGAGGSSYTGTLSNAYTISGTNSGNGEVIISYTTTTFAMPLNLTQVNICTGGSVALSATGQQSYTWSTGSNAAGIVVSPSVNTTYSVAGTNSLGCFSVGQVSVMIDNSLPNLNVNASASIVCQGSSVTLNAAGANSYTWSAGVVNGNTFVPTSTTIYTVTGSNGCGTASAMVSVSVNPIPTLSVSVTSVTLCAGNSTVLTASGANSYTWTGGVTNGAAFTPTASNVYTVTGSNNFGCSVSDTVPVTVLPSPSLSALPSSTLLCGSGTVTILAGGAPNFTWMPGGSNTYSLAVSPTATAVYSLSGSLGSCIDTKTVSIVVAPVPTISAFASTTNICSGTSITFSATGAGTYTWSGGVQNAVPYFPTSTSAYTVTGQNVSSCTGTAVVSVSVTATPSLPPVASQNSVCAGGTVTLSASGATGYTWMPANSNAASLTVSPLVATTYTIVKQNGACVDTQTLSIAVIASPVIQVSAASSICAGETTTMTASGAQSYTWAPSGITTASIVVSPAQTTSFSVTGFNGACTGSAVTSITVNPIPNLSITASSQALCRGQSLTLVAGGGNSYTWTSPASISGLTSASVIVSPSLNTTYAVSGANAFQCLSVKSQSVQVLQGPAINASASANLICEGALLSLSASGASNYTWSAPGNVNVTTQSYSLWPTSTAVYTVIAAGSSNSCTSTRTVQVVVFSPSISINAPSAICAGETATLSASGAFSYTWNPNTAPFPFQTLLVTPITNTVYYLAALSSSNGLNCVSNHSVAIQVNQVPNITIYPSKSFVCTNEPFSLIASGAASYTWSGGQTTSTLNVVQTQLAQTYTLSGTSALGCSSTASILVNVSKCTGIEEHPSDKFQVYPNPSQGIISIQSKQHDNFTLINNLGQVITSFEIEAGDDYKIEGLAAGVYYLVGEGLHKAVKVLVISNP